MSLLKAVPGANPAGQTSDFGEDSGPSGNAGMLGYVKFALPDAMPAQSNFDVQNTGDLQFSSVDQGTNLNSYRRQPALVDPESGYSEAKTPGNDLGPAPGGPEQGAATGGDFDSMLNLNSVVDDEHKPADGRG
jgi:hypothetical protein